MLREGILYTPQTLQIGFIGREGKPVPCKKNGGTKSVYAGKCVHFAFAFIPELLRFFVFYTIGLVYFCFFSLGSCKNVGEKGKSFIKMCKKVYKFCSMCYTMWAKCNYYVIPGGLCRQNNF